MTIKTEELNYSQGEYELKAEYIFLEKADKPSTRTGNGIIEGVLMLTNKRLLFFAIKKGKSSILAKFGIKFSTDIVDQFTFGLASLVEYGIEKGVKHSRNKHIDMTLSAQSQESFAIPLQRIVSCEKFGGKFSLSPKARYIRIGVLQNFVVKENYSIYSVNPKNTQDTIQYEKWFDIINDVIARV